MLYSRLRLRPWVQHRTGCVLVPVASYCMVARGTRDQRWLLTGAPAGRRNSHQGAAGRLGGGRDSAGQGLQGRCMMIAFRSNGGHEEIFAVLIEEGGRRESWASSLPKAPGQPSNEERLDAGSPHPNMRALCNLRWGWSQQHRCWLARILRRPAPGLI